MSDATHYVELQSNLGWFEKKVAHDAFQAGAASRDELVLRYFDLVRYMRSELFEKELIDEDEYASLCIEGGKDGELAGSVARLEGYDKIRAELASCRESLRWALEGMERIRHANGNTMHLTFTENDAEQLALARQRTGISE